MLLVSGEGLPPWSDRAWMDQEHEPVPVPRLSLACPDLVSFLGPGAAKMTLPFYVGPLVESEKKNAF